jgi:hypothetical protein
LFDDHDRLLGTDFDAFAAVGAPLLPDAKRSETAFIRLQLLALDRIVLADLSAFVAHGAQRGIDLVSGELLALVMGADTLDMPIKVTGAAGKKSGKDIGMVLAFFAHTAVLHINGNAFELGSVLFPALPGLDRLKDLDRFKDTELTGMALGAHAVLGIVIIEKRQFQPRGIDRAFIFLLRHDPSSSRS